MYTGINLFLAWPALLWLPWLSLMMYNTQNSDLMKSANLQICHPSRSHTVVEFDGTHVQVVWKCLSLPISVAGEVVLCRGGWGKHIQSIGDTFFRQSDEARLLAGISALQNPQALHFLSAWNLTWLMAQSPGVLDSRGQSSLESRPEWQDLSVSMLDIYNYTQCLWRKLKKTSLLDGRSSFFMEKFCS